MRQVLAKTANIKQFVEEKYHEPREAIHEIEQRLKRSNPHIASPKYPYRKRAR